MSITESYHLASWGLLTLLTLWLVQWFVASGAKATQPGAVPGKIDSSLSHQSFVFRAHRTFMNSLETLPLFLATTFLALMIHANPFWVGALIWVFVIARLIHMLLYYFIATEKNPSPRTYAFLIGLLANVGLLIVCFLALLA